MQLGSPPDGTCCGCSCSCNPAVDGAAQIKGVTFRCVVDPSAVTSTACPTGQVDANKETQDTNLLHPGSPMASSVKDSPGGGLHAFSSVSGGDVGWEDDDGMASMSGYSAHSGKVATDPEGHHSSFYIRLVRFYQKYNPEKIPRAEEFLAAYRGEEEQLFAILVSKYGPEPPQIGRTEINDSRSENGSFFLAPAAGIGVADRGVDEKRFLVPTIVSAQHGNTDCVTPYWPGNKLIMDTDLLSLLSALKTSNEELRKCFLGVLAHHPTDAFNGMCYITRAALPQDASTRFLGHVWSGSLANNKLLVFEGQNFQRCVLHCTTACQMEPQKSPTSGEVTAVPQDRFASERVRCDGAAPEQGTRQHERWRLTIFRSEASSLVLFRTVWDPVIELGREIRRNSFTSSTTRQKPVAPSASAPQPTSQVPPVEAAAGEKTTSSSVFSFFSSKKEHSAGGGASASSQSSSGRGQAQPVQPSLPMGSEKADIGRPDVSLIIQRSLHAMETKILARLDDFERRLAKIELEVSTSKQAKAA